MGTIDKAIESNDKPKPNRIRPKFAKEGKKQIFRGDEVGLNTERTGETTQSSSAGVS